MENNKFSTPTGTDYFIVEFVGIDDVWGKSERYGTHYYVSLSEFRRYPRPGEVYFVKLENPVKLVAFVKSGWFSGKLPGTENFAESND